MSNQQVAMPQEHTVGLMTAGNFELSYRVSKMLSESTILPAEYRGNISNCMIALNMAQRIGADPMMTMQNLIIIHGKPTWSSQFLIATFNTSGRFSSIRYEFFGEKGTDDYGCRATAIELSTGEKLVGTDVTIAIAKAEGWYQKNGSKWKTMPQQMLQYRAAAWFIRTVAPELSMGLHTQDEIIDIEPIDVTPAKESVTPPKSPQPKPKSRSVDSLVGGAAETIIEVETVQTPSVQEVPQATLQPEPLGTMPIPELQPEPPKPYVNLHEQWKIRIDNWQTLSDISRDLQEMPPVIKSELKPYYTARQEVIKSGGSSVTLESFDEWKNKITKCNSRDEFTAVQKSMPPIIFDSADIKKFMQTRESFCMQNYPELW